MPDGGTPRNSWWGHWDDRSDKGDLDDKNDWDNWVSLNN